MNTPTPEAMTLTLADLQKVQGTALLIGGIAVGYHGFERVTHDIDILYAHADGKILKRLKADFKMVLKAKNGWHHLEHRKTGVRLELIPEGGLTTYGFIPGPKTVGGENGIISLHGLVWLKLVSGRSKDIADIVEVAKTRIGEFETIEQKLPPENREKFREVLAQAKRELAFDPHRLPDNLGKGANKVKESAARYGKKKPGIAAARKRRGTHAAVSS